MSDDTRTTPKPGDEVPKAPAARADKGSPEAARTFAVRSPEGRIYRTSSEAEAMHYVRTKGYRQVKA